MTEKIRKQRSEIARETTRPQSKKKWSQWSESNRWPIHYEWIALPTELHWHLQVTSYNLADFFKKASQKSEKNRYFSLFFRFGAISHKKKSRLLHHKMIKYGNESGNDRIASVQNGTDVIAEEMSDHGKKDRAHCQDCGKQLKPCNGIFHAIKFSQPVQHERFCRTVNSHSHKQVQKGADQDRPH